MAINTWHRLQFVQERDRLYGAVDGTLVIETRDLPSIGTGGILDFGHVGLRAMLNTHICFRNLKILSRPAFEISERS